MGDSLDVFQAAAVSHRNGPAFVLAGPGSGKTTVIIRRSVQLVRETGRPERLLSVTFTRAAGAEMALRFRKAAEESGLPTDRMPVFQTVHAFCNQAIAVYERETGRCYTRIEGETGGKREILAAISRQYGNRDPAVLQKIYREYKEEHRMLDFDDMVSFCLQLLRTEPAFRSRISSLYDYIQIDEGQDLSREQYAVIRGIAPHRNLFLVADDDQSIYRFRGADPSCLFDFVQSYSDCARYALTRNYRSSGCVVASAACLIEHNQKRFDKKLYTEQPPGKPVRIRYFSDRLKQARFVCAALRRSKTESAVLYRNNGSAFPIRILLEKLQIPYRLRGDPDSGAFMKMLEHFLFEVRVEEERALFLMPEPEYVRKRLRNQSLLFESLRDSAEGERVSDGLCCFAAAVHSEQEGRTLLERLRRSAENPEPENAKITLSTVHSAKGLEFDTVYMIDLAQGEFPDRDAEDEAGIEEERRLFYVGMTRAAKELTLCCPLRLGETETAGSPFLYECTPSR